MRELLLKFALVYRDPIFVSPLISLATHSCSSIDFDGTCPRKDISTIYSLHVFGVFDDFKNIVKIYATEL